MQKMRHSEKVIQIVCTAKNKEPVLLRSSKIGIVDIVEIDI